MKAEKLLLSVLIWITATAFLNLLFPAKKRSEEGGTTSSVDQDGQPH